MKNCVINPKTRRAVKTSTKLGKSILAMLGESMGGHSVGVQAGGSSLANATPIAVVRKPRGRPRKAPVIVSTSATGAPAQIAMLSKTPVRVMRNTSALAKSVPNVRGAKALSNRPSSAPAKNISGNYEPYFVPTINMSLKSKKSSTPKAVPIVTPRRRVRVPLPPVRPPAGGNRAFVRRPARQVIRTTYKTSS